MRKQWMLFVIICAFAAAIAIPVILQRRDTSEVSELTANPEALMPPGPVAVFGIKEPSQHLREIPLAAALGELLFDGRNQAMSDRWRRRMEEWKFSLGETVGTEEVPEFLGRKTLVGLYFNPSHARTETLVVAIPEHTTNIAKLLNKKISRKLAILEYQNIPIDTLSTDTFYYYHEGIFAASDSMELIKKSLDLLRGRGPSMKQEIDGWDKGNNIAVLYGDMQELGRYIQGTMPNGRTVTQTGSKKRGIMVRMKN